MVTGAATAAVLFCIFLELGTSGYTASCMALVFAFSAAWWKFATDADSYVASTFFLTVCVWLLVRKPHSRALTVGIVLSAAMLLHQLAALFFPAAVLALWTRGRTRPSAIGSKRSACLRWREFNVGLYAVFIFE
jgi:hypothetical protein